MPRRPWLANRGERKITMLPIHFARHRRNYFERLKFVQLLGFRRRKRDAQPFIVAVFRIVRRSLDARA